MHRWQCTWTQLCSKEGGKLGGLGTAATTDDKLAQEFTGDEKRTKASKIMPSLFLRYISTMFLKDQDDQDDANERTQVVVPPGLQAPAPKKN